MLEIELTINQLQRAYEKEKSILKRIHLETAIKSLKEFEKLS